MNKLKMIGKILLILLIFGRVRERLGTPDLMIAECGQYDPGWAGIHMFPEETVQAAVDANAKWLIPVHGEPSAYAIMRGMIP